MVFSMCQVAPSPVVWSRKDAEMREGDTMCRGSLIHASDVTKESMPSLAYGVNNGGSSDSLATSSFLTKSYQ